ARSRLPRARPSDAARRGGSPESRARRRERAGRAVRRLATHVPAAPRGARGERPRAEREGGTPAHLPPGAAPAGRGRVLDARAPTGLGSPAGPARRLPPATPGRGRPSMSRTARPIDIDPDLDLVLERVVDVPPHLVWKAWTEPRHLKEWFAPRPWTITDVELDLRPG